MKFGGSSVADASRVKELSRLVSLELERRPVLVLSAMGDTTDHLLEAAEGARVDGPHTVEPSMERITETHLSAIKELGISASIPEGGIKTLLSELGALLAGVSLIGELSPRSRDLLLSFGERLSVRIVALYLSSLGINARAFDAWEAGLFSNSNRAGAELLEDSWKTVPAALLPLVNDGILPVVTGFIAKDKHGSVTTLGRGGSDLSATFIAAACAAEEAQVWKDVDGIMTYDPRVIKSARPVPAVTYEEAAELAYFGAQVLHPRAMLPCSKAGIPVRVKNSYNPSAPGTLISDSVEETGAAVRALTSRRAVTLVDIVSARMVGQSGFLAEVFKSFAARKISVDMVATSEVSISVTLDSDNDLCGLKHELSRIANVEAKSGKAIVTVVCAARRSSRILERVFALCAALDVQVQMVSQGASKVNVSFVVNEDEAERVVRALHAEFFES
jgi:aspartate kinase